MKTLCLIGVALGLGGEPFPASLRGTTDGAHGVFLFHDLQAATVALMPAILDALRSKGCRFVTVLQWVEDSRARTPPKLDVTARGGWVGTPKLPRPTSD